jgi:DNA processing protein
LHVAVEISSYAIIAPPCPVSVVSLSVSMRLESNRRSDGKYAMTIQTPYWIALSRVPGIGPARMRLLLDHFGSADEAWGALYGDLLQAGLDARTADALAVARQRFDLDKEMQRLAQAGVRALTWESEEYPERLREVDDSPPVLYVLGEFGEADGWAVGVVGTRRSTSYGREVAARICGELAEAGVTIVSGLARGIDSVAHSSALEAGGRTVAVLGSGLDVIYPYENRGLVREIVEGGRGAVVSEYPLGTQPDAVNFPPRNRIISILCTQTTRRGRLLLYRSRSN